MAIRIGIVGGPGKMGRQIIRAVMNEPDLEFVFAVGGPDAPDTINIEGNDIPVAHDLKMALAETAVDTVIDFTNAAAFCGNAPVALEAGVNLVSGTTGVAHEDLEALGDIAKANGKCFFYAANFAIGAVLMMRFAEEAAKFMPEVEIIELHHDQKKDAPSGTAIATARRIAEVRKSHEQGYPGEKEILSGARGSNVEGMHIHSVRLPGYNAHQEVIFGGLGQTLTIRHDSINRESFMPGIMLACKSINGRVGLVENLDSIMF